MRRNRQIISDTLIEWFMELPSEACTLYQTDNLLFFTEKYRRGDKKKRNAETACRIFVSVGRIRVFLSILT